MDTPRFAARVSFWLLLGLLSTFFAEFLAGSAPNFLLTPFGYTGIIPIYLLHTLLLASLAIHPSRALSLRSLYLVSLLFGMYEAYITKVLWEPSWNPDTFRIANIAVLETSLLVFFWHAVFSFILPLLIGEYLLTDSRRLHALLPEKWQPLVSKNATAVVFGLVSSVLIGTAVTSIDHAIAFTVINCGAVTLAMLAWRFFTRKKQYDIANLLPRRISLFILCLLLLLIYLFFGFNLNRQVHPGVSGHAVILLLYALIIILIIRSLRKDKEQMPMAHPNGDSGSASFGIKQSFIYCGSLLAGNILINLMPQSVQDLTANVMYLVYSGAGIYFVIASIRGLFKKKQTA